MESLRKPALAALKFARPRIIMSCWGIVLIGAASTSGFGFSTLLALAAVVTFTIHANSINDYTDLEIDRINLAGASDRPLVTGDISMREFWIVHLSSGLATFLIGLVLGAPALAASAAILAVDYLYSLRPARLTDRTFISPVILAAAYVYYPLILGTAQAPHDFPWGLSAGLFLGFFARMLLKDFRDVNGDSKHGKITFLVRFGEKKTALVSGAAWLAATATMAIATWSVGLGLVLLTGTIAVIFWLRRMPGASSARQQQLLKRIANLANLAVLAIFLLLLCRTYGLPGMPAEIITALTGYALMLCGMIFVIQKRTGRVQSA